MLWNGGVPGTSSVIRFFGDVFAWISLLAGAFDGLENLALIKLLLGSELTFWNGISRWSALAKFGLLLFGNGLAHEHRVSSFLLAK